MIYLILGALTIAGIAYLFIYMIKKNNDPPLESKRKEIIQKFDEQKYSRNDDLSYTERLNIAKTYYPFEKWRNNFFEHDMDQYSEENCTTAKNVFDSLITKLIEIGENGNKIEKEKCFEIAVKSLNKLNEKDESIIETGEREDLCELIDEITIASGLIPEEYAEGDGIADLWREW
jgi:hypothetical protein